MWEKQTKRSAKEIKAGHVNITPVMPGITHSLKAYPFTDFASPPQQKIKRLRQYAQGMHHKRADQTAQPLEVVPMS